MKRSRKQAIKLAFWFFLTAFCQYAQPLQAGDYLNKEKRFQDSDHLILKNPLSRDYKNGAKEVFHFSAKSGDFIEIVAEQRGVDISLAAFSPSGKKIIEANSPTKWFGNESLVFYALENGSYQIEVSSARTGKFTGSFQIELSEQRLFLPTDENRLEAVKQLAISSSLWQKNKQAENLIKAVKAADSAAVLFAKANDPLGEAKARLQSALILYLGGKRRESVSPFEKSLALFRAIGDRAGEAFVLSELGQAHHFLIEREKAVNYLNVALSIRQALLDRLGESETLSYLCRYYNDTGALQAGLESCRKALALRQDGDPAGDVWTYNSLGNLFYNLGNNEQALNYYQLGFARAKEAGESLNPMHLSDIVSNIGSIKEEHGEFDEALDFYTQSLKIGENVGHLPSQAFDLATIGELYSKTGRYQNAVGYLEGSLKIYNQLGSPNQQRLLNALAGVYSALKQHDQARSYYEQALQINRLNFDRYAEAETLYNYAKFENALNENRAAANHIRDGIEIFENIRASILSKNHRTTFVTRRLRKLYELQIDLLMRLSADDKNSELISKAFEAHERSRARTLLEIVAETGFDLRSSIKPDLLNNERRILENISLLDEKRLRNGRFLTAVELSAIQNEIARLSDERENLQEEIRRSSPSFAALNAPKILSVKGVQNEILDGDTVLIEYSLGEKQSYAWLISKNNQKSFNLPKREELNSLAKKYYGLLSRPNSSAANEKEIEKYAADLSKAIFLPIIEAIPAGKRLIIVADGALQYIPFGALPINLNKQSSTASPITDAGFKKYAIESFEIVYAPSISTLAALRKCERKEAENLITIMADPVFDKDDERVKAALGANVKTGKQILEQTEKSKSEAETLTRALSDFGVQELTRLPFSGREAFQIKSEANADNIKISTGFDATRQRVMAGEFDNHRILHFATHGLLNSEHPELSGVVLSLIDKNGQPVNGFLRAQDIYGLNLAADLVVLSACQTAIGKEIEGEGLMSLTRGFMHAGVPRVIASLWKVDDSATAELMRNFYRALLKENKNPSAALQSAKTEMLKSKRWSRPSNWAGFVLQGDW